MHKNGIPESKSNPKLRRTSYGFINVVDGSSTSKNHST